MARFLLKLLSALGLFALLVWAYLVMPQSFFSIDSRLRDFMFVLRGEIPTTSKVVIVDIDEKSLQKYGQWPWSRNVVAELLYRLRDAGAGIIGLDIVFAEEDRTSPHKLAALYPSLGKSLPNYDALLAKCFLQTPVVGGYIFTFEQTKGNAVPHVPAVFIERGMKSSPVLEPKGVILNIDILQKALYSSGFFNNTPDEGGMIRRVPLVMRYKGMLYPSLPLEMLRIYSESTKVYVNGDEAGVRNIGFGEFDIPTDRVGRLVVNFRGGGHHFDYISAADILAGNFNHGDVENKFVLVGTSAVGLFDLRSIPFDNTIAGVEVHANVLDNILRGDYLVESAERVLYDIGIIFLIVFVSFTLFSFVRSLYIVPVAVGMFFVLFELFYLLMFEYGLLLNLFFPLVAFVLSVIVSVVLDYMGEARQKEQAKKMLGKKVSPAVMEYLLEHVDEDFVSPRELEATVFFSDIRGFTTISEQIASPVKLIELLNSYMTPMVEIIIRHKGTIDKFIGDAIMAYWNAPLHVKNHADEAVRSALEQIETLHLINKELQTKYAVSLRIGIGVHTGVVTAGDMGSKGRSDYTVIGDNVNFASRLEGLTKQYGVKILISAQTREKLQGHYTIRPIDFVIVKGKHRAVEIFEVIVSSESITSKELEMYGEALELFRKGQLEDALKGFESLQKQNPHKLYEQYIERCKYFLLGKEPFTPVLTMTTK